MRSDASESTRWIPSLTAAAKTPARPSRITAWPAALPSAWAGLIFRPQTWQRSLRD
jgi:hypothetical protein